MDNNKTLDILLDLNKGVSELHADVRYLREELREHAMASAKTKDEVDSIKRDVNIAKGAIAFLLSIGSIVGFFKLFKF